MLHKFIFLVGLTLSALPVFGQEDVYECGSCGIVTFNNLGEISYSGVYQKFMNGVPNGSSGTKLMASESAALSKCEQIRSSDSYCNGTLKSASCSVGTRTFLCNFGHSFTLEGCRTTCYAPPRNPICEEAQCVSEKPQQSRCYCGR